MKITLFKNLLVIFIISVVVVSCTPKTDTAGNDENKKPNIVFILTDDHAFQAISAYDDELMQTPNIDRLADEGMLFERAFVTNSICAPSRAVILTGKHSHINGLKDNGDTFDSTQVTFPKILQDNGYQTAIVGKWHLKTQPMGFDYWKVLPGQGHYYNPEFRTAGGNVVDTGYVTDLITDFAINWIDETKNSEKPFMIMYQHKAPHREWLPAEKDFRVFTEKQFPEPETLFDDYSGRGTAAKQAEMRISDHMGLSNDNKIEPEIVEELGFEPFMDWYPGAYENNLARMNEAQRSAWEEVYGPINQEFKENTPEGKELTRWKYQRYMQDYLASHRRLIAEFLPPYAPELNAIEYAWSYLKTNPLANLAPDHDRGSGVVTRGFDREDGVSIAHSSFWEPMALYDRPKRFVLMERGL